MNTPLSIANELPHRLCSSVILWCSDASSCACYVIFYFFFYLWSGFSGILKYSNNLEFSSYFVWGAELSCLWIQMQKCQFLEPQNATKCENRVLKRSLSHQSVALITLMTGVLVRGGYEETKDCRRIHEAAALSRPRFGAQRGIQWPPRSLAPISQPCATLSLFPLNLRSVGNFQETLEDRHIRQGYLLCFVISSLRSHQRICFFPSIWYML